MKPSDPYSSSIDAASQDGRTPALQPPDIQPSASQPRIAVDHAWSNGVVAADLLAQLSQGKALDVFVADVDSSCQDHTESVMKAVNKVQDHMESVVIAHRQEIDQMNSRFNQKQRRHEAEVATLKQDIQLLKRSEQQARLAQEAAEFEQRRITRHIGYSTDPPTSADGLFELQINPVPEWRLASERLAARDAANRLASDRLAAHESDGGVQNPASPRVFSYPNETQEIDIDTLSDEEHGNAYTSGMRNTNHRAFDVSTLEAGVLIGTAESTHRSRSRSPVG